VITGQHGAELAGQTPHSAGRWRSLLVALTDRLGNAAMAEWFGVILDTRYY